MKQDQMFWAALATSMAVAVGAKAYMVYQRRKKRERMRRALVKCVVLLVVGVALSW